LTCVSWLLSTRSATLLPQERGVSLELLGERRGGDVKAVSAPRNPVSAAILQNLEDGLV